ncbi:hypothetical protein Tco_1392662, partial [Tanacetum coccineum]
MENYKNVSQDIRDQLNTKAEAIQIILTRIDKDIYSTVDAYPNACEMWKEIERLKQVLYFNYNQNGKRKVYTVVRACGVQMILMLLNMDVYAANCSNKELEEFLNDDSDPFVSFFYLFCLIKFRIPTKVDKGKVAKVRNVKSTFQLDDEPNEEPAHSEPEPEPEQEGAGEEYDIERAIQMSLELFQAQGHAHVGGVAIQELVAEAIRPLPVVEGKATKEASTGPSAQPQDDMSANIIRDSQSTIDVETGARSDKTSSGSDTKIAGSDPGETLESRPQPEQVHMEEDQAGPDPGIS